MADKYFVGNAIAVAQVSTGEITAVDATPANNTFTVTINGVSISVAGVTSAAATAAALVALLNASTHPYFSAITWSVPSAGQIRGTADTAGVPFTATLSETGAGTGAVTDFSTGTAATSPNHWDAAANWSDGSAPGNADTARVPKGAVILWGLAQSGVTLARLVVELGATIGLDWREFTTAANGSATSSTAVEDYRDDYLYIGADAIDLGVRSAADTEAASANRVKIRNAKAGASDCIVWETPTTSPDSGLPVYRYRAAHASADVYVRSAAGGLGIGVDVPGETATVGDVLIADTTDVTRVTLGAGVTATNYFQNGGTNRINAAATVTKVEVNGGTLQIEGDYTITTLEVNAGTVLDNHKKTGGNANTTVNLNGGVLNTLGSDEPRTWATTNHEGGSLYRDSAVLTLTTYVPPTGRAVLAASDA